MTAMRPAGCCSTGWGHVQAKACSENAVAPWVHFSGCRLVPFFSRAGFTAFKRKWAKAERVAGQKRSLDRLNKCTEN